MRGEERLDALGSSNLPVHLTSFVGRESELVVVGKLLTDERLVTLTGAGGSGKTRLAGQAAAQLADRWPDGVWWVDLSSITDPDLVARTVTATLDAQGGPPLVGPSGPLGSLARLADRRLLVCLDNCEHVLDASAEVAEALLRSCPQVSVLATSREPLGVPGEMVWRVPSLTDAEAVALFVDRAHRVRPWFTLDHTSEAVVRTLCQRLDGTPLAIELAAAWMGTLTPAQIVAGLDDRFALLVRGPRGVSARQQTLGASIDWSHDLLDETDRVVFRRLAVFAGGFTLDAARSVAAGGPVAPGEVLAALGRLVDKSLVVADELTVEARYRLLETIREYAHGRLDAAGETDATRDRHLDHYLALAETAEPHLESADQDTWLTQLATEHDNLRAALDRGLTAADPERGRRLAAALVWMWRLLGDNHEGTEHLRRAIARSEGIDGADDRSPLQARLLTGLAWVSDTGGPQAIEAAQRGLEIATANGDVRIRGRCLLLSAFVQFFMDFDAAWELCAQARDCAEATDDRFVGDSALVLQGVISSYRDQHEVARPLLQEGLERCLDRGDRGRAAWALNYLDDAAARTGDLPLAEDLATRALRLAEPLGDYFTVGFATSHLALVKGLRGDIAGARQLMEDVIRPLGTGTGGTDEDRGTVEGGDIDEGAGGAVYVPNMAPVIGKLCLWSGDLDAAVGWFGRDVGTSGPGRDPDPADESLKVASVLPGLGAALRRLGRVDEARTHVDRAVALAQRLDVPFLRADALDESAHLVAGHAPEQAEDLLHQALALRVEHGLRTSTVDSLDAVARLAARAESFTEATRLLAASDAARTALGCPRPPVDRPDHDVVVAQLHGALGPDDFTAAWKDGSDLSLDEAVAYACRARGARGRPSTGWASLTPTELDVVRLVADGLTNPEIGARLFVSRATVKTHLSHVYAKLGVTNRTELAALATNQLPSG